MKIKLLFIVFVIGNMILLLNAEDSEKPLTIIGKKADAYYKFAMGHLFEINNDLAESLKNYQDALKIDPDSADIKMSIADIYRKQDKNNQAVEILLDILKKEPENAMALKELGSTYYDIAYTMRDNSYLDKAIEVMEKAKVITPDDASIYLNLGRLYSLVNRNDKAIEILDDYISRQPDSLVGYEMLENIYEDEGNYEKAAEVYEILVNKGIYSSSMVEKLLELYQKLNDEARIDALYTRIASVSQNTEIIARFAALYRTMKQLDKAEKLYALVYQQEPDNELLVEDYSEVIEENHGTQKAIEFLEKHIAENGMAINLGYKLGLYYGKQQDWEKAEEIVSNLIKILQANGEDLSQEDERILKTLYIQRGFISQQVGKFKEAIDYYEKAAAISSLDTRIQLMLAYSYYQNKDYDKAIEIITNARKGADDKTSFNVLLAEVYTAKGDIKKAEELFEELVEKDKNNKDYVMALAEIYEKTQEYEKAEKLLSNYLSGGNKTERILFMLGAVSERLKKYEEAEDYFREALKLKPDFAPALNYLGYMLIERDINLEESIEFIKKAVDLDKENGAYLDSLGWGYYKLDKLDLALEYLQKAIIYLPDNPVICDHLGDVYYRLGKKKEALEQWKRALQKKNNEINEEAIRDKIGSISN